MGIEKAKEYMLSFIERMYEENTDPNYDIAPMVHMMKGGHAEIYTLPDGPPMDMAKMVAELFGEGADIFLFASSIWTRDPITRERNGEGVMVIAETPTSQEMINYKVERTPLPVLTRDERTPARIGVRVGGFIYQPRRQDHETDTHQRPH